MRREKDSPKPEDPEYQSDQHFKLKWDSAMQSTIPRFQGQCFFKDKLGLLFMPSCASTMKQLNYQLCVPKDRIWCHSYCISFMTFHLNEGASKLAIWAYARFSDFAYRRPLHVGHTVQFKHRGCVTIKSVFQCGLSFIIFRTSPWLDGVEKTHPKLCDPDMLLIVPLDFVLLTDWQRYWWKKWRVDKTCLIWYAIQKEWAPTDSSSGTQFQAHVSRGHEGLFVTIHIVPSLLSRLSDPSVQQQTHSSGRRSAPYGNSRSRSRRSTERQSSPSPAFTYNIGYPSPVEIDGNPPAGSWIKTTVSDHVQLDVFSCLFNIPNCTSSISTYMPLSTNREVLAYLHYPFERDDTVLGYLWPEENENSLPLLPCVNGISPLPSPSLFDFNTSNGYLHALQYANRFF
ncbi:hypothetical protein K474DRAFT_1680194 [Panus rudis PR-1116 ss-1]|nr:hypothetical protein K474DRAFT_1680194 [Panus rudis PR-1116 ss-1]